MVLLATGACRTDEAAAPTSPATPSAEVAAAPPSRPPLPASGRPPLPNGAPPAPAPPPQDEPSISGCLVATTDAERRASQPTRSPGAELVVEPGQGGVAVIHVIQHACCLTGRVDRTVAGGVITIREELAGTPCRCMCSSRIRTPVRADPGEYHLVVETVEMGKARRTEHEVTIR